MDSVTPRGIWDNAPCSLNTLRLQGLTFTSYSPIFYLSSDGRWLQEKKNRRPGFSFSRCVRSSNSRNNPTDHRQGKSSLVIQFIESHFVESYYPTIESSVFKSIKYDGVDYDCEIIDTAGQVGSSSIHHAHLLMRYAG